MCGINVNMCAALMHVISDLMRSTTTLIESIVILSVPSIPSDKADGYSTLVVCMLIAAGTLYAVYHWVKEVRDHCSGKDNEELAVVAEHDDDVMEGIALTEDTDDTKMLTTTRHASA